MRKFFLKEGNGMTFLRKQLDAERAKVAALEAKIERINPIQSKNFLFIYLYVYIVFFIKNYI